MGLTALLPLRRKASEDFFALKNRRLRLGANPRTWVPKASTLPLDHQSPFCHALLHALQFPTSYAWVQWIMKWKNLFKEPNVDYSRGTVCCWKCWSQHNEDANYGTVFYRYRWYAVSDSVTRDYTNSLCVPITFWCQRVNKDTCIMAYLCAVNSSVYLLACYYEMLHSKWKYNCTCLKNYNERFI